MESLTTDWKEFLRSLISRQVKFLLVGGHALAIHARARFTEDLDVFVEASSENAQRIRSALEDFGFGDVAPTASQLSEPDKVFMLGRKPFRIDILTSISGVRFEEAWPKRITLPLDIGAVPVIDRDSFVANKEASGRPKDLADLAMLEAIGARDLSE